MTVKELITVLQTFNPDLPVYTLENTGYDEWEWTPMTQPPIKDIIDGSMNPEQIGKEAIFL